MDDYTVEQAKAAAKKALAAGDQAAAKRWVDAARALEAKQSPAGQRIAAAKAGTLQVSQESLDRAANADAIALEGMGPSVADDLLMAGTSGYIKGAAGLIGLPGTVMQGARDIGNKIAPPREGYEPLISKAVDLVPNIADVRGAFSRMTHGNSEYQPKTELGEQFQTGAEFVPSAVLLGPTKSMASMANNAIRYGLLPGMASEKVGQAVEGKTFPDFVPLLGGKPVEPWARAATAIATPVAMNTAESAVRRAITPNPGVNPLRLSAAERLKSEGIKASAGQKTGDAQTMFREAQTKAGINLNAEQSEQFTRAVMRRIDIDGIASPTNLKEAGRKIGSVFDDVGKFNYIKVAPDAAKKAADVISEYSLMSNKLTVTPLIGKISEKIATSARTGVQLPGEWYIRQRSLLSKLTTSSNPADRDAAVALINILDDGLEAGARALGNSADVAALAAARPKWRDFVAIRKAAGTASQEARVNLLTPAQLDSVVRQQQGANAAMMTRPLQQLTNDAALVLERMKNPSGTAGTLKAQAAPILGGATTGGGIGFAAGGPIGAGIGTAVGGAVGLLPTIRNAAIMTDPMQYWLANQALGAGPKLTAGTGAVAGGLLSGAGR